MHNKQNISRFCVLEHSRRHRSNYKERSRRGRKCGYALRLRTVYRAAVVKFARELCAHGIAAQYAHTPHISAAAGHAVQKFRGAAQQSAHTLRKAAAREYARKKEEGEQRGRNFCPEQFKPDKRALQVSGRVDEHKYYHKSRPAGYDGSLIIRAHTF